MTFPHQIKKGKLINIKKIVTVIICSLHFAQGILSTMRRKILLLRNNKTTRLPFVLFVTVIIFVTHFITDIIVRHETIDNETFHFSSIDKTSNENDTLDDENWIPQTIQFTGFDNAHGAENSIIPNIIHFIRYDKRKLSFAEYIVVLAAMRNHKPDRFFFHSNIPDFKTTGKYWNLIRDDHDLWSRIHFKYLEAPKEIFGKPLSERWRLHHGSDIGRLKVLMKYGGIYLDNDVYIVKSLEKYLKYECVINWEENQFMNTQVIIAHKDARFLHAWLETYKSYNSSRWYKFSIHLYISHFTTCSIIQVLQYRGTTDN